MRCIEYKRGSIASENTVDVIAFYRRLVCTLPFLGNYLAMFEGNQSASMYRNRV